MTYTARFERGGNRYNLSPTGSVRLARGTRPPGTSYEFAGSVGTSANRYGGTSVLGKAAKNRAWSLELLINTSSQAQAISIVRGLVAFLTAESTEPLYFAYKEDALPEPVWGQLGAMMRYEVVSVNCSIGDLYPETIDHQPVFILPVDLETKPAATGVRQKLPASTGGCYHERLGLADGSIRGLRVCEATTNKMTNPVFAQYGADSNWNAGSAVSVSNNYLYKYQDSIKSKNLSCSSASNNTYTQSINVGNTNKHSFSAVVRRFDGAAVTSADVSIYYGASKATSYQSLGNGMYLIYADNIDGINSATATGVVLANGAYITLLAFQAEEKAYHTPICYGDMEGCYWNGTRNASTSTRIVAFNRNDFSWRFYGGFLIVWSPDYASTATGDRYLFGTSFYFNATDDKFYLTDGTNTISSAAQTFAAGDVLRLMCTYNKSTGMKIYKNGVQIASGANYDGSAAQVNYIGHNNASNHAGGIFLGFDMWTDVDLTNYVAAIDTAASNIIAQSGMLDTIPMLWTATGSSRSIINHTDSTTHQNYLVVDGIPGDQPAITQWQITPSQTTKAGYMLIHTDAQGFHKPDQPQYYVDEQGTADANASGGEYKSKAVTIAEPDVVTDLTTVAPGEFFDRRINFFVRMKDSASSRAVQLYPWLSLGAGNRTFSTTPRTVTIDTSWRWFYAGSMMIQRPEGYENLTLTAGLQVSGSGSFTVHVDFMMAVPGVAAIIKPRQGDIGASNSVWVQNRSAHVVSATAYYDSATFWGSQEINLVPGRTNIVFGVTANDGEAHVITDTLTMIAYITPKWSLL